VGCGLAVGRVRFGVVTAQIVRFPVLGPPGWRATEPSRRSNGEPCPTSGTGYRAAGRQHPAERPILYDAFNEVRGEGMPHGAADITCAYGAPIVSSTDGVVKLEVRVNGKTLPGAGQSPKGGGYAWIEDAGGNTHYYAHMRALRVRPGQRVRAGEQIGECSDAGNARGSCPHLHYAIHTPRGKTNPFPLLKPIYDAEGWKTSPLQPPMLASSFPWIPLAIAAVAGTLFYLTVKK
jgi:murein DD-endopeptidase MepM/ murein hydrolase activator NlpD